MQAHKPFDNFLLVSDMDGTLLNRDFSIHPANLEAIGRFIEKGGRFTVATGRADSSASHYIRQVRMNAPGILCNGSAIYDFAERAFIWTHPLPGTCVPVIEEVLRRFPDIGAEAYHNGDIYIINENDYTTKHVVDEQIPYQVTSISDAPGPWTKVLFAGETDRLREIEKMVGKMTLDGFYFVFSGLHYFEMLAAGVSKGSTLEILADLLQIPRERTAAIGDYYNDLEMIRRAGIGAAVADAPEQVRAQADTVVCACREGAVADFIASLERRFS
jgi:Cof subfamily protein (haloacid dehalogenase superfamily)